MTDDRLDKLMDVMLEFKEEFTGFKTEMLAFRQEMYAFREEMYAFRQETKDSFERLENNVDLLARKHWNTEKDVDYLKKQMATVY